MDITFKHKKELFSEFFATMMKFQRLVSQKFQMPVEDKIATMLQMQTMKYLKDYPKSTVGEVAQELFISSSSIAQLTDRLVVAGDIERVHDNYDRRIVRLSLTSHGEKELARLWQFHQDNINKMLSYIPEKDLKEMIRIHKDVLKRMEEDK
jgi:DNA-binding MarR family transcriptional regulator